MRLFKSLRLCDGLDSSTATNIQQQEDKQTPVSKMPSKHLKTGYS